MKNKILILVLIIILLTLTGLTLQEQQTEVTESAAAKLSGKILLQVEQHGEAWYVDPNTQERHFLGTPQSAYSIFQSIAAPYPYIQISEVADQSQAGRVIHNSEDSMLYYIEPDTLHYKLIDSAEATFMLIKEQGIGVPDALLETIPVAHGSKNPH